MNYATWKEEVTRELRRLASTGDRQKALITYGVLAERANMKPFTDANWHNHPLSIILGEIDDDDARASRPFITSLVVSRRNRVSGHGLFTVISAYRRGGVPVPETEEQDVWSREVDEVLEHYRQHRPTVA